MSYGWSLSSVSIRAASRRVALALPVALALLGGGAVQAQKPAAGRLTAAQIDQRVNALLKRMTVQEKVGQLSQYFALPIPGLKMNPEALVRQGAVGSFLFVTDPNRVNQLQRVALQQSPDHIPLLFGYDVIHGFHTVFPVPLGMAATWNPGLYRQVQTVAADEASAVGIRWTFGPMVDIARDARWGRMVEGAGEDPVLGAGWRARRSRDSRDRTSAVPITWRRP